MTLRFFSALTRYRPKKAHLCVLCWDRWPWENNMGQKRPKVLMFGWEFPPFNSGGLGVACHGLTEALIQENVDITFVLPRKFGDPKMPEMKFVFADKNPVKIYSVDSILQEYVTVTSYNNAIKFVKSTIYGSTLFEEVKRYAIQAKTIAMSEEFDIIHAHDWLSIPAGLVAKEATGKPLIVHIHATEFDRSGGQGVDQRVYDVEREGMQKADAVIAVSNLTKSIIVTKYGIPESKIEVIHNGVNEIIGGNVDINLTALKEEYKLVLFVGRLTIQKGPDIFLKVAREVLAHYEKVIFIVAGSGDMKEQLINEAAALGISDRVIFTGFMRDESLRKLFSSADLFVMPSVSEPFGITALESLISGTPVLVSKQSGASEVVIHSLKTDYWDVNEMTNQIVSVLSNDSLQQTLKENGYMEVQGLRWTKSARKTKDVYKKVMNNSLE